MAGAGQHVIARGRVQQRIEAVMDDIQNSHGICASACSSKRTRRNAPFIVVPPCQSDIKLTLKRQSPPPKTVTSLGFLPGSADAFGANGEWRVSGATALWFRNGGRAQAGIFRGEIRVNRKFTANQIIRIFCGFSPN